MNNSGCRFPVRSLGQEGVDYGAIWDSHNERQWRRPTTAAAIVNATTTTLHRQFIRTHACTGDKPRQSVSIRNNTKEPG